MLWAGTCDQELHGDFERLADVDAGACWFFAFVVIFLRLLWRKVGNWGFRRLNVRLISA